MRCPSLPVARHQLRADSWTGRERGPLLQNRSHERVHPHLDKVSARQALPTYVDVCMLSQCRPGRQEWCIKEGTERGRDIGTHAPTPEQGVGQAGSTYVWPSQRAKERRCPTPEQGVVRRHLTAVRILASTCVCTYVYVRIGCLCSCLFFQMLVDVLCGFRFLTSDPTPPPPK
jgi:hypothetical protein